jgi:hypothetical protein
MEMMVLGQANDNIEVLKKDIAYLERYAEAS